jgi:methionyl-tRNA formyltransferase
MNIYALCTLEAGLDVIRLVHDRIPLTGIIGLAEREPSEAISGYVYMGPEAEALGLDFHPVSTYGLKALQDQAAIGALDIDLLIVCGWQRLAPLWLIEQARLGAIGAHGSPAGIAGGRGRSPQNWALIAGARQFDIALFWLDPGVDAGPVIANRTFPLDDGDDIASSYLKVSMCVADMIVEAHASGAFMEKSGHPQDLEGFYLPQRLGEDGDIDWSRSAVQIARFVAALGRPYPGARTSLNGRRLTLWRARPLRTRSDDIRQAPGRLVMHSAGGALVIETGDGLLLVDEFEVDAGPVGYPQRGQVLDSADFNQQVRGIIDRHCAKHPDLPVAALVTDLLKP